MASEIEVIFLEKCDYRSTDSLEVNDRADGVWFIAEEWEENHAEIKLGKAKVAKLVAALIAAGYGPEAAA